MVGYKKSDGVNLYKKFTIYCFFFRLTDVMNNRIQDDIYERKAPFYLSNSFMIWAS